MTTFDYLAGLIEEVTGVPARDITLATKWNDLGVDSLDLVDVVMQIETDFGCQIPDSECEMIVTAGELASLVDRHKKRVPG